MKLACLGVLKHSFRKLKEIRCQLLTSEINVLAKYHNLHSKNILPKDVYIYINCSCIAGKLQESCPPLIKILISPVTRSLGKI